MANPPAAFETWKPYAENAHILGWTVPAIIGYLNTHGHEQVTTEDITAFLKDIGQLPKFTYLWYNWSLKATKGLNPTESHPWNSWSSRFILNCKGNSETNSTIFAKMRRLGYEIPGEHWVQVVIEAHQSIEDKLARGCYTHDNAALETSIVKAHEWGYTVPEIAGRIFARTNRPMSTINISMVKMALEGNGIPEGQHRNGRKLTVVAMRFILSAYNLGMDVNSIRDQLYVHGFNHSVSKPIVNLLKKKGICQEENPERARTSQVAQPAHPRAREDAHPRQEQVASLSAPANEKPGRTINVRDLLN